MRPSWAVLLAGLFGGAGAVAAAGDGPSRGEQIFQYCYACHSVEPGETNLQGPNLKGIVGSRIASQDGFDYSPAMRAFADRERRWSEPLLDAYLADPQRVVPKTRMAFPGLPEEEERAAVLAYLRATGPAARP